MKKTLHSEEQKILQEMLKDARKQAGLTQAQLADALGKPQSFVAKYENGERLLNVLELIFILRQLGQIPADFVQGLEQHLHTVTNPIVG